MRKSVEKMQTPKPRVRSYYHIGIQYFSNISSAEINIAHYWYCTVYIALTFSVKYNMDTEK